MNQKRRRFFKIKQMKYIPILFSTPMVQAILEGRKLMTRRTKGLEEINKNPNLYRYTTSDYRIEKLIHNFDMLNEDCNRLEKYVSAKCPYGKVGDVLWVRETFVPDYFDNHSYGYKADWNDVAAELMPEPKWKPSLFMPKAACRIFLEITDVRVERLRDITSEDAIKEGIERKSSLEWAYKLYGNQKVNIFNSLINWGTAIESFYTLWQSINGKESWDKNPWVWVISFKRIEKPIDFG